MKLNYTIRYAIYGAIFGFMFPIFSTIGELYFQGLGFGLDNILQVQRNSILLLVIDTAPFFLGLFAGFSGRRQDILSIVNSDLENQVIRRNEAIKELDELRQNLEIQVEQRTASLQQRTLDLQATTEVGRRVSSVLNIDQLIQEVTEIIRERFNLYYVGLFMVDDTNEWANLVAGTGEAGRAMLSRGHRIRIGEGMIGWSIANSQPRIALEAKDDKVRLATSELPETQSEAAIPLRVRSQVTGAITVQDTQPGAFDDSRIAILQSMADLVGVAIDNARLYTESQETLDTLKRVYGDLGSRTLSDHKQIGVGFKSTTQGTTRITLQDIEIQNQQDENKTNTLKIPIRVRDVVIGEITTQKPSEAGDWHPEEISLIQSLVEQLGVALEGAKLYEETQRQAYFEQLTREVSTRIRETLDLESVLQTAASEFRRALDLAEVEIRMGMSDQDK